jgi:rubredoxin
MFAYLCQARRKLKADEDRTIICDTVSKPEWATREPIVAGSLEPGTTGVNYTWVCPRCGFTHKSGSGTFRLVEVMLNGQ